MEGAYFVNGKIPFQIFNSDNLGQNIWNKRFFLLFVPIYYVQDCLREKLERENGKKTMSKCHIPERSHVTKPLLLSNNVVISPTEHA